MALSVAQLTNLVSSVKLMNSRQFSVPNESTMLCSLRTSSVRMMSFSGLRGTNALDRMVGKTAETLHSKVAIPTLLKKRRSPRMIPQAKGALPGKKEEKWIHEGLVTESLPNGMFHVQLDNEDVILGYVCGKIRKSFIRIIPGDKVKIEVSRYDSTRGRITYRVRNKDLNN